MGKASVLWRTPLRNSSTGVYDVQLEEADAVDAAVMEAGAGAASGGGGARRDRIWAGGYCSVPSRCKAINSGSVRMRLNLSLVMALQSVRLKRGIGDGAYSVR